MNIKTVAKGLIVAAMSMFALAACTDEEKMTPEEALRMMSKSNISDAKYIYIRQATGTRTDGGEEEEIDPKELIGAWKVDAHGNETKVKIFDINGEEMSSNIYHVDKIGDSYLRMFLTIKSDSWTVDAKILVDKTTNKIYECPLYLWGEKINPVEYPKGTLYYATGSLYKISITSSEAIEERVSTEEDFVAGFLISKGEVAYFNDHWACPYEGGGQLLMPSKRRYPVNDLYAFVSGERDFFTIKQVTVPPVFDWELHHWKLVSESKMEPVKVGSFPGTPYSYLPMNALNGKAVVFCNNGIICEVDTKSIVTKKIYTTWEEITRLEKYVKAISPANEMNVKLSLGDCNYCLSGNSILNFDANTYEITETEFIIPEDEYRVRSMEIDPTTGKVVFRALRYMDSANVLGEVDKNGVVSIISEMHPTYDISVYCALN